MKTFLQKLSLLPATLALLINAKAQDVHFSQYTLAPMLLNPALAGLSRCDYRVATNFRTQWTAINGLNTYSTVAGSADFTLGKITRYNSFAGAGISFFYDQAGDLKFNTNRLDINAAYHFMLNRNGTMSISGGLQGSFNYRRIDFSKATFDSQWDNSTGAVDPNGVRETFGRNQLIYGDAGFGLFFSALTKKDHNVYLGFSVIHVNQPRITFYPNTTDAATVNERLYMKLSIHGGSQLNINRKLAVTPHFMALVQGPAQQYNIGGNVKMKLSNIPTDNTAVYFGAQYRGLFYTKGGPVDAVILSTRVDYKAFTFAFSYDINVSKLLPATNTVGGPELVVMYQGCFRKKPRPGHCPAL
ncbi:MAG: PorP/SprF family type IX secretion system membrane protein [Chitinophagales bacterium]|nr:PorP/SprF family type IX secretion system membrane protein [Chitinophagales bacterium]